MKTKVKMYNWKALARLAIRDMCEREGVPVYKGKLHYIGGVDTQGKPFLRIDLTPLVTTTKK